MKKPQTPPSLSEIQEQAISADRLTAVIAQTMLSDADAEYLHWDKLRRKSPPGDLSHREWWCAVKFRRGGQQRRIPLKSAEGEQFTYALPDSVLEGLQNIDQMAGGRIEMPEPIVNAETKDRYLIGSLMEEAIRSSQLEGAATTRRVAKEMIRTHRPPRDLSERMIMNNFRTMERLAKLKNEQLSRDLILEIHRQVTEGTLKDPSAAGRFRRADEKVVVWSEFDGEVFHTPPTADQLEARMSLMCDFANGKPSERYIHPVVRSIILHFWLAYDHPFMDGNGRTARALFYWSMLHNDFWLCEFISISEIILKGQAKYERAFLYTETDDNDLTYFLLYHLDVIRRAIDQLYKYVGRKTRELQALESELRGVGGLNHRQRELIRHALRHPHQRYTVRSHCSSHKVVYQTARTDLLNLVERGLLEKSKVGREWQFTPVGDLEPRLRDLP